MRPLLCLIVTCFFITFLCAQDNHTTGIIHDSILVSGTNDQSFALYLPKSYTENRLNPILFIFEPLARGSIGVQAFVGVAEKYGLVLVCSNNSRNGPYERNFAIANHLFDHVFTHFNIKEDEMYISGFSGGSRLASAIASLTDKFAGVIGCGAGFSGLQEHMPSAQDYSYVGLCGNRDMNYNEMLGNKDFLTMIKFNSTLITYNGDHNWPPHDQIERAFDWLYLQKAKKSPSEQHDQILTYYQTDYECLSEFKKNNELLFVAEQYERLLKDYKGLVNTDSLAGQYRELRKSKTYKKQTAALDKALTVEAKFLDKFRLRFSEEFEKENDISFKWWENELKKLESFGQKEDVELQKMMARVKYDLFARAYVRKNMLIQTSNTEQVNSLNRLLQLIYPRS